MDRKATTEEVDQFRSSLEDIVAIAEKLAPYCKTADELIGMSKLAIENDGQLRLLLATMTVQARK